MINRKAKLTISCAVAFLLFLAACKKHDNKVAIPAPGKPALTAPEQNSVCTTGTVISNTQSSVTFSWAASQNTDGYSIYIKNLLTNNTIQQSVKTNTITVRLERATPYSWYVTSGSAKTVTTSQSDTWKFYNSGLGISSYAPFPADLVSPAFAEAVTATGGTVTLSWTGSDADNDIVGYDVYFGTSNVPALYKDKVTTTSLSSPTVASGNMYYWKIVTTDSQGNTSASDVFQFSVR